MKRYITFLLIFGCTSAYADINNPLIFEEPDGSPSTTPSKVKFTNGAITDNGDGSITVNVAAGASGISSSDINTSAELATIITDEIGTGNILFNTNPILSSDVTITGSAGFLYSSSGVVTSTAMIDNQILVATGVTTAAVVDLDDCDDSGGNHLNYDTATRNFTCGTSSSATNSSGWNDNGAKIVQVTSSDGVVVGPSPTELGKLTVSGDTDEVQLAIKAHTSQTANVIEVKNSAGTNIASLNNAGNLTLAGTLTVGGSSAITTLGDNSTASYTLSFDISGVDQTIIAESGKLSMSGDLVVATETYDGTGWNGDLSVPTKDALRDKFVTIPSRLYSKDITWPASATLPLEAADSIPPIAKDAGTNFDQLVVDFDADTDECRQVDFDVPEDINTSGSVIFEAKWYSAAATSGNIIWDFRHNSGVAEGADPDQAATVESAAADATQGTAGQVTTTRWIETVSNLGWAVGDTVSGTFCRDANNGSDTLAGDARTRSFRISIPRS